MKEGGWLDVPAFLESIRQYLLERACYAIANVRSEEVEPTAHGTVRWKNIEADRILFAEGWRAPENRFFDWIRTHSAAGDILEVSLPGLGSESRIINRGAWLLPLGEGRFRAGSTYRHDWDDELSARRGRDEVIEKIRDLTSCPFEVLTHVSAIRPVIRRSQIFGGPHPQHESVILFNGLGSKGVLNGPWHADRLVEHLLDGRPLPEAMDLRRLIP